MSMYIVWAIVGSTLIVIEMMTGTFYLLVIGLGAFGAALAAWFGQPFAVQSGIAVVLAVGGVLLLRRRSIHGGRSSNADMDIGQQVTLESWQNEGAGLARVKYRGAPWDAQLLGDKGAGSVYFIHGIENGVLRIGRDRPARDASS